MKKTLFALSAVIMLLFSSALASVTVQFAGAFEITHPDDLQAIELTQDDISEGMVYAASNDNMDLYIWSGDMDGMTADELYSAWQEDDYLMNVQFTDIGQTRLLSYDIESEGKGAVIAGVDDSYYEIMCFYEYDAGGVAEQASEIMSSITAK